MPAFSSRDEELVYLARKLTYVRELSGNHGQRVNALQAWGGGKDGDSWCAFFATFLLDVIYQGKAPIPRTGSCDEILALARSKNWLSDTPVTGDLYLVLRSPSDAHHVGIVTNVPSGGLLPGAFMGLSGNTNNDGSDNGDGVYEKLCQYAKGSVTFIRYPRTP